MAELNGHPDHIGLFLLRRDGDGPVFCTHCDQRYPCPTALDLHVCAQSMFCTDVRCDLREEWAWNRAAA